MPMTSKELIKLLKKNGFEEINSNGSHRKLYNDKNFKIIIDAIKIARKGLKLN